MKDIPDRFKLQFFIFIALLALLLFFLLLRMGDERSQQAEESYKKGETSTTISARKTYFNQALSLFLQLDAEYQPNLGSGKLSYNIGNTYFQLGEYPLSILYYKRAEKLMPRSDIVERNLLQAYSKINIKPIKKNNIFGLLLLEPILSLPERIQIFFTLALVTLIFISWWLWTGKPWISKTAVILLSLSLFFLLNLGVTHYFASIDAVLIHAAELRRDAGNEFAKVGDLPIPGGTTVEVLGSAPNGKWLKVVTSDGEFGFVPNDALRVISK